MKTLKILNITPDSFSDGSEDNLLQDKILTKTKKLTGAGYLDIGAQSTRPGAREVSTEEELRRLEIFLEAFDFSTPLSLDSRNPQVVKTIFKKYEKHFAFLNDVHGLRDPLMLQVIAENLDDGVKLISMHSQGGVPPKLKATEIPDDFYNGSLFEAMKHYWQEVFDLSQKYGIKHERIILDPGLGFGKNLKHSLEIIDLIPKLKQEFGSEILIGASRKSFLRLWKASPQASLEELDQWTQEYNDLCIEQGAEYLRIH